MLLYRDEAPDVARAGELTLRRLRCPTISVRSEQLPKEKSLSQKLDVKIWTDWPDKPLYHYCDATTLQAILKSNSLWATHPFFLNDKAEAKFARQYCKEHLAGLAEGEHGDDTIKEAVKYALPLYAEELPFHRLYYVASLTTKGDLLSQWRGYGGQLPVSIGFNRIPRIRRQYPETYFDRPFGVQLVECVYSRTEFDERLHRELGKVLYAWGRLTPDDKQDCISDAGHLSNALIHVCNTLIPSLKHKSFKEEEEWRLVATVDVSHAQARHLFHFRSTPGGLAPYIEIPLSEHPGAAPHIAKIVVGPGPGRENTKQAIETLLKMHAVNAAVEESDCTYTG